ncbi:MAG: tryptophan--tRNA ligase [candidate division KSB1 bacterium]|nr:tryptophan--tRNA ligase [candidate division KSB1 bacterium]MDZ7301010.1 tryptophan--tRNA ligase [candidate division KSB1 bacterium]MDZ7310311.1 tryptophan--tRNA ligase [candidate division KSB1 bacterium]
MNQIKKRILSGMRPTGRLHLGHYVGALENWVKLQAAPVQAAPVQAAAAGESGTASPTAQDSASEIYENFHLIADYHVLTTDLDTSGIYENTLDMVIDWLAAGIRPDLSPIFRQSQIKEHAELFLIFSMLITKERLERNPTVKEQARDLHLDTLVFGHLGYPVLQAADILLYKGQVVPVGEDQLPHIEIAREIARKFNTTYGAVFPEPEGRVTQFARLPGLDGQAKMSKSLGNSILLSDSPEEILAKMRKAVTDPQKIRRGDPGRPDICLVFTHHRKFNPTEESEIRAGCESGQLGCVECKTRCATRIAEFLAPMRVKRAYYEKHLDQVKDILIDGEKRARQEAQKTMAEVHKAMKLGEA